MPISRSASTSTSTSLAVISICGVAVSRSSAIFSTAPTRSGRSLMMSELVRFSTRMLPRLVSEPASAVGSSAALA